MTMVGRFSRYFRASPARLFVLLSSFFGIIFLILIPPLQSPDETSHFLRAYEISQGDLISKRVGGVTGAYLPKSIDRTLIVLETTTPVKFHPELKYHPGVIKDALRIKLQQGDTKYYDISTTSSYSPIAYIPQAIGILIGRIFNAPPVLLIYLARLAILAVWVILGYLSIKLIPYKKWALFGILLFPMFIAQSVSMGADAVSIGAGLVFTATILRIISLQKLTQRTIVILVAAAVAMVMAKQIMVILLPLILLLKGTLFTSKTKAILIKLAVIAIPILLFSVWNVLVGQISSNLDQALNNQNPAQQISFLSQNPLHFISVLFTTFFFGWGNSVVESVIGVFGWSDTALSEVFVAFGYVALAVLLFTSYEEKQVRISRLMRWTFGIMGLIYTIAVCGAMYLFYSPVGFSVVVGVQGRYLLPVIPLLIPVIYGFALTTKRKYVIFTLISVSILFIASVATVIFRYYIDYKY